MAPTKRKGSFKVSLDRPGIVVCVSESFEDWLDERSDKGKLTVLVAGCFVRGPFRNKRHGLAANLYKTALENEKLKGSATEVYMVFVENDPQVSQQLSDALMELKEEYKHSTVNVKFMIINLELEPAIDWVLGDGFQFCESGKSIFTPPALPQERFVMPDTPFKVITDSDALPGGDLTINMRKQIFGSSLTQSRVVTAWFNGKSKYQRVVVDNGKGGHLSGI